MNAALNFLSTRGIPWGVVFSVVNLSVIVWWVRGMAARQQAKTADIVDRERVRNESNAADHGVATALISLLREEVARLSERVSVLEEINKAKDNTIADMTAQKLGLIADLAAQKVSHSSELAAEGLLKMAALAEAQVLRPRMDQDIELVKATEHGAVETGRVADAAERALGNSSAAKKPPAKKEVK